MTDERAAAGVAPQPGPDDAPFWDGRRRGPAGPAPLPGCGTFIWYPRTFCPDCHTFGVDWVDGQRARHGLQLHRQPARARGRGPTTRPYVIAYVELEKGPRVLTNIVGVDPKPVRDRRRGHGGVRARRRHQGAPLHPGWLTSCSTPLAPPGRRQARGRSSPEGKDSTPMGRTSSWAMVGL